MSGFEPEGLVLPGWPHNISALNLFPEGNPQLVEAYRYAEPYAAARGITTEEALMGEWGMYGWDAAVWLIDAMRRAGPALDGDLQGARDAIRDALENTSGLEHVDGTRYTSPTDHCGISAEGVAVLLTIEEGNLVLLEE